MGGGEVEVNMWCLIARAVLIGGAGWETNWKIGVEIVESKTVREKLQEVAFTVGDDKRNKIV